MVMMFALMIMMIVSMFFMSMLVMVVMLMFVLIMVVLMHVFIFFNTKCDNTCVGAFDAAFDGLLEVISDIGDSQ